MTDPLDNRTTAVWTRLVRASEEILSHVEAALKAADLPPLAWYDVLLELDRAGPQGLRPFALQERLLLQQYGTSRLLKRLEDAGLVATARAEDDGRGQIVTLTDRGRTTQAAMWPVYATVLRQRIETRLDPAERQTLAALLARLRDTPPVRPIPSG